MPAPKIYQHAYPLKMYKSQIVSFHKEFFTFNQKALCLAWFKEIKAIA